MKSPAVLCVDTFMTATPFVVPPSMPIPEVARVMRQKGFNHLPVVNSGVAVGILSDRDIQALAYAPGLDAMVAGEIMSRSLFCVPAGAPLEDVAREMAHRHVGAAIVLADGEVKGIFTVTDALVALAAILSERSSPRVTEPSRVAGVDQPPNNDAQIVRERARSSGFDVEGASSE